MPVLVQMPVLVPVLLHKRARGACKCNCVQMPCAQMQLRHAARATRSESKKTFRVARLNRQARRYLPKSLSKHNKSTTFMHDARHNHERVTRNIYAHRKKFNAADPSKKARARTGARSARQTTGAILSADAWQRQCTIIMSSTSPLALTPPPPQRYASYYYATLSATGLKNSSCRQLRTCAPASPPCAACPGTGLVQTAGSELDLALVPG